jgi:hypothetical protein
MAILPKSTEITLASTCNKTKHLLWRSVLLTREVFLNLGVILGFHPGVSEICIPLWYYAAYIGSLVKTFRDTGQAVQKKLFFDCLNFEDGTDKLSRNVVNEVPIYAA